MEKNETVVVALIYVASTFLAYAIARYMYVFGWAGDPAAKDVLVTVRVVLSAPGLIILGALLIMLKRALVHCIFGVIFLLLGIAWASQIILTVVEETAYKMPKM